MPDQNKIDEWLEKLEGIWTEGSLRNLPDGARAEDERAIEGFGASHGAIPLPNGSVPEGPGTGTEVRVKFTREGKAPTGRTGKSVHGIGEGIDP